MSTEFSPETASVVMEKLAQIEETTDLENLSVINRTGMRLATSKSAEMDADATTASSSALIDLGEKMAQSVNHGDLREILLRNEMGYGILMAISEDLMIFGTLTAAYKIGY
ncbi:MAG: roadblock/LC7 domain-containing protein, partial [Promethearchaeota archaeon]